MGYIFKQLDTDGNGQISPMELEKMYIPCEMRRYTSDFDFESNYVSDPNIRLPCPTMFYTFFGRIPEFFLQGFPDLEMYSRQHGWRSSIMDKVTNAACEILT